MGARRPPITKRKHRPRQQQQQRPQPELLPHPSTLTRSQTIHLYHTLNKQLASIATDVTLPNAAARASKRALLTAQLSLIGMQNYQKASRTGEQLTEHLTFDCSKWVINTLKTHSFDTHPVRLLDVGAIVKRFPPQVDTRAGVLPLRQTAIDLQPEASCAGQDVLQADLIEYANDVSLHATFDVVCLSLCLNFEGCPRRRAAMLRAASALLKPSSTLFITLPSPCITNSRYVDMPTFKRILLACGFQVRHVRFSNRLLLCVATQCARVSDQRLFNRRVIRSGTQRNNFCICVRDTSYVASPSSRTVAARRASSTSSSTSNSRRKARRAAFHARRTITKHAS